MTSTCRSPNPGSTDRAKRLSTRGAPLSAALARRRRRTRPPEHLGGSRGGGASRRPRRRAGRRPGRRRAVPLLSGVRRSAFGVRRSARTAAAGRQLAPSPGPVTWPRHLAPSPGPVTWAPAGPVTWPRHLASRHTSPLPMPRPESCGARDLGFERRRRSERATLREGLSMPARSLARHHCQHRCPTWSEPSECGCAVGSICWPRSPGGPRSDSEIWDLSPPRSGRPGRPALLGGGRGDLAGTGRQRDRSPPGSSQGGGGPPLARGGNQA
jgi:hypothetical protein